MKSRILTIAALAATVLASCVKIDGRMGADLVDSSLKYDTYTAEFPLENLEMRMADNLSGYSDTRLAIGAIRDDIFGLTTRSSAVTLVPAMDTLDLGKNPRVVKFDIHFAKDSTSVADKSQEHIIQNINVYALTKPISSKSLESGTNQDIEHSATRISRGVPVYDGTDSLSFEFTEAYAKEYLEKIPALENADHKISSYEDYVKALPGIYITVDPPAGNGGRINMFELSCLSVSSGQYYRNGNVALLTINSEYDGVRKDTTFLFIPGEPTFYYEAEYISNNTKFYQYAFNRTSHETRSKVGNADEYAYIEGGGGLKPVVLASELRNKALEIISQKGGDPTKTVINHATIYLPFEVEGENFEPLDMFPTVISPTCMIQTDTSVTFAGLSDASARSENQGDIDRSLLTYRPDITHHFQEIIRLKDLSKLSTYDIWFLTVHTETVESSSGYSQEYLQQLAYAQYYNSLYGGYGGYGYGGYGYGGYGYGGYGGYGGYSNYYNYLIYANMLGAASSSKTTTTQELDKDRYYCGILNGPGTTKDRKPHVKITFSVPKK